MAKILQEARTSSVSFLSPAHSANVKKIVSKRSPSIYTTAGAAGPGTVRVPGTRCARDFN